MNNINIDKKKLYLDSCEYLINKFFITKIKLYKSLINILDKNKNYKIIENYINKNKNNVYKFLSKKIGFIVLFVFVVFIELIIILSNLSKKEVEKQEEKHYIQLKSFTQEKVRQKVIEDKKTTHANKIEEEKRNKKMKQALEKKRLKKIETKKRNEAKRLQKIETDRLKKIERENQEKISRLQKIETDRLEKIEIDRINEERRLQEIEDKRLQKIEDEKQAELQRLQQIEDTRLAEIARIDEIKTVYLSEIMQSISKYQKYPLISRAKKEEGVVEISFRIHKDGNITNVQIKTSSTFERLDKAALKIFNKMKSTYKMPSDIKEKFMDISVPISFKIKQEN